MSTILLEKECFLKVDLQWFLYNFRLWPRVVELFKVKNLLSFELLNNVKTRILSPLNRMYFKDGSFRCFNLSTYDKSFIVGISFVALLWTFSISLDCLGKCGDHIDCPYFKRDLTRDL